jgi:hypothetical protein
MPLEHERAFSANSPVGRYWLRNCVGFHVEGFGGGSGTVEEIGLGPDGVDVLAVRRGVVLRRIALVPAQRVESVDPWDETIVLVSRRRQQRDRRRAQTQDIAGRVASVAGAVAVESARALRDGAAVVLRGLAAFGTLLLGLAVVMRNIAPRFTTTLKAIAVAYMFEARRAWRAEQEALATWRGSFRGQPDQEGDEGPLTRAGADEVDARTREPARRR